MSGSIVWLASYPKSGSTWFRAFISNLIGAADNRPVSINSLVGRGAAERTVFDNLTGIDSGNLFPGEAEALLPVFYTKLAQDTDGILWLKTHDTYRYLSDQTPVYPMKATRCTIYLIRNPLDVAPSFARHMGIDIDQSIQWLNEEGFVLNEELLNSTHNLSQQWSSWSGNVVSWLNAPPGMNVHLVRYEDLKNAQVATFTQAVVAIGLEKTVEEIRQAIEHSSFMALQNQEKKEGFREKPVHSGVFFYKGESGSWRTELSCEQVAAIVEKHGDLMRCFGYLDSRGNPV